MSNEETIQRFIQAVERGDVEQMAEFVADDVEMEWPQSGERFRGKENALKAMQATEIKPEPAGEPRILGSGDLYVLMMPLRYGEEIWHYVGVYQLEGGKIRGTNEFFGTPFPASEARAPFTER
ncbi:MAG: nuclear transport factor 2 family protein [Chloroflexota bacterium]|nr:nuclear transport factor 2 family protein [Chloroflexota bacterium]